MWLLAVVILIVLVSKWDGQYQWKKYHFKVKAWRTYADYRVRLMVARYRKIYELIPTAENRERLDRAEMHWQIRNINWYLDELKKNPGIRICPGCGMPVRWDLCICQNCGHKDYGHPDLEKTKDWTPLDRMRLMLRQRIEREHEREMYNRKRKRA